MTEAASGAWSRSWLRQWQHKAGTQFPRRLRRPYLHVCKNATRCNRTALGVLRRLRVDGNFPPVANFQSESGIFISTIMNNGIRVPFGWVRFGAGGLSLARSIYYCSTISRHSKNTKKSTETPCCSPARLYCFHPFFSVHFKNAGTSLEICPGMALSLTHAGMFPSGLLAVAINHSHPSSPKSLTNSILS